MYIQPVWQYSYNINFGNSEIRKLDQAERTQIIKNTLRDYVHGRYLNDMLIKQPDMLNQLLSDTTDMSEQEIKSFVEGLARNAEAHFSCNLLPHS